MRGVHPFCRRRRMQAGGAELGTRTARGVALLCDAPRLLWAHAQTRGRARVEQADPAVARRLILNGAFRPSSLTKLSRPSGEELDAGARV